MSTKIYRFKSVEEADRFEWIQRIKQGLPYWEFDRFEYARLCIAFEPGIYKFRTFKEKEDWEFTQVCENWKQQN